MGPRILGPTIGALKGTVGYVKSGTIATKQALRQTGNLTSHYLKKIGPKAIPYGLGGITALTGAGIIGTHRYLERALRIANPGMMPQETGIGKRVTPAGPGISGMRFDFNRNIKR